MKQNADCYSLKFMLTIYHCYSNNDNWFLQKIILVSKLYVGLTFPPTEAGVDLTNLSLLPSLSFSTNTLTAVNANQAHLAKVVTRCWSRNVCAAQSFRAYSSYLTGTSAGSLFRVSTGSRHGLIWKYCWGHAGVAWFWLSQQTTAILGNLLRLRMFWEK